jgi:hypothetical protein
VSVSFALVIFKYGCSGIFYNLDFLQTRILYPPGPFGLVVFLNEYVATKDNLEQIKREQAHEAV